MSCAVAIDEKQLLHVIHEYLEQTGRIECLSALENDLKDDFKPRVPTDLAFLRRLCLNGCWEDVLKCVEAFESFDHSQQCLYEVNKQWYLEGLSTKHSLVGSSEEARVKLLSNLLSKLKKLCSSEKDYLTLCSLLDSPTSRANPDCSTQYPARLKVFHIIASWMSKIIYPDCDPHTILKMNQMDPVRGKLVQLVAKGLMYEKCEGIALSRCNGERREKSSQMFDLCAWMQQQPDSAFQVPPSCCQLTYKPQTSTTRSPPGPSSEKMSAQISPNPSQLTQHSSKSRTDIETEEAVLSGTPTLPLSDAVKLTSSTNAAASGVRTDTVHTVSTNEMTAVKGIPPYSGTSDTKSADTAPDMTFKKSSSIRVREAETTPSKIRVLEEFEDNFIMTTPPSFDQLPRTGRDSSTPKPSSNKKHLQPSPPTSPVGGTTPLLGEDDTDDRSTSLAESRRHLNRTENIEEFSIEWPTASLLSQVKDTQAVRSVAFSQSGSVVAIGANSRTLRLCSTTPLTEERVSDELPVFYHHASYHKGSIYCLAWSGDTLLASGSNDHKLRLLSYNPTMNESPCKSLGELSIHPGTVRDVAFTPHGLLVSGGAVDMAVKVSDCTRKQVIASLAGHTEQVLAVDIVEENLIVSGSQDKTIKFWDIRQQRPAWSMDCDHPVNSLSVNTLHNEVVSSHSDGSCSVHDLSTSSTRVTYHPHSDDCRSVQYSPRGGKWILSGSYDGTVCVAERGSLEWQQVGEHSDKVVQVRWHCGGTVLATTGADKKACFWSLR